MKKKHHSYLTIYWGSKSHTYVSTTSRPVPTPPRLAGRCKSDIESPPPPCNSLPHSHPLRGSSFGSGAGQAQRFWSLRGRDMYIPVPTYCGRQICAYFYWCPVKERDLYICLLVSCEREICTYVYWRPVRERFVHIYASFWWERDLCCTCLYHAAYMYCERERVVYIFFQCPVWERDLYTFVPASGEREICTVHMGTSLLWETDLYIFFPVSCEREVFYIFIPASG